MTTTAAARRSRRFHPALVLGVLLAVASAVPAAALPPPTLASTPETDLTDPFLIAKAAALGHDPAAIFAFVRDEIAYEVYAGSLRGARGTLWSGAGNSADKASLLVGLLRVSGVPARWVRGTLPDPQAKLLIASMFPALRPVTGCVSPSVVAADPVNDPELLAEARDHFWAQLDDGGGFRDADPSFAGAMLDDTFTGVDDVFDVLPDAVRHRIRLRLRRELTSPFAGLLTGGAAASDVATVLDTDAPTAQIVGRPLTFGHFVSSNTANALFAVTTHTYSPYVIVGGSALDPTNDGVARGVDYQETLTSFPGGSQVLTGVFLEIDLVAPGGATETFERTLLDRIGVAGRRLGGVTVSIDVDQPAQISPADLLTIEVLGGRYDPGVAARWNAELPALHAAVDQFEAELLATPQAERAALGDEASTLVRDSFVAMARTRLAQFLTVSDEFAARNARNLAIKAYHARPRLTLFSSRSRIEDGGELVFEVGLDLLENGIRALPWPGQNPAAAIPFQLARGLEDTAFEAAVIPAPDPDGTTTRVRLNAAALLDQAKADGIPFTLLHSGNRSRLADLDLPEAAVILIGDALDRGRVVLAPERSIEIGGEPRAAWYELDPATGEAIGVLDDGSHGIVETIATAVAQWTTAGFGQFIAGYLAGFGVGAVADQVKALALVSLAPNFLPFSAAKSQAVAQVLLLLGDAKALVDGLLFKFPAFVIGYGLAIAPQLYALTQDPPLADLLIVPAPQPAFDALGGPGLDLGIEPEPLLFLPFAGAAVPTLFRLGVHNGGATEDVFDLSFDTVPPGFTGDTSVASVPVAPGETAEIGVCLAPSGPLGAPGSNAAFTVRVTPQSNPGGAVPETEPFLLPAIHGVVLEASPSELATTPGMPVGTTITLRSAGNVSESIGLSLTLPPGLGSSGLPANVMLAQGDSTVLMPTFTPSGATPLNTTLTAVVTASFGGLEPVELQIPVRVGTPGADAVHAAAIAARELGEEDLAQRFEDLGVALNELVSDPTDAVLRGQALANCSSMLSLLGNLQPLAGFVPDLEHACGALAAAGNGAQVLAAINELGAALDPFADQAAGLAAHAVEVFLTPSTRLAQPGQPAVFDVLLHNVGTDAATYDLAAGLVPAGVTAMLSQASVVLAPDAFSAGITLTLTQNAANELVAGAFRVDVSPQGFPGIVTSAHGSLLAREDFVSVVAVTPDPAFVDAGDPVDVSARLLNAVNREQPALVSYRVLDPGDIEVFASAAVATTLTVQTSLVTLDLGTLDTTGFGAGVHTIEVTVTDPSAVPIPGGEGSATLLIGSPVTAALSVTPEVVAPGDATVSTSLTISSLPQAGASLTVVGQLPIATAVFDVAINGDLAYVCGAGGVHVVDVTDRTMPSLVTTKSAFPHSVCEVAGSKLIALDRGPDGNIAVQRNGSVTNYELSAAGGGTPANPFRTQTIFFNYQFLHDAVVLPGRVFATTNLVRFDLGTGDIFGQYGDVFSFNTSNPGNLMFDDVLFNTNGSMSQPPLFASGSNFNMFGVVQPDASTLLVGSTTATAGDTQTGSGILRIIDVSNPAALAETGTFVVPGTKHVQGIALDGDLALVLATDGGWRDPFTDVNDIGPTGSIVVVTLDVSDPQNPVVLDSQTVARSPRGLSGPFALGSGQFVFSSTGLLTDTPRIYTVDASDPMNPVVGAPLDLAAEPRRGAADASYFYLADGDGLTIFSLGSPATPITASVRVPNDGSVEVVPGSFNVDPDSVVPGAGFDTLTWTIQNGATLSWNADLPDMLPGESRDVALGATIDFVYSGTPGSIELAALAVASEQILAIDPPARTVAPGASTTYTLTVRNPTAATVTYTLAVLAVPPDWVDLQPSVQVGGMSEITVELTLAPDPFAVLGDYDFTVLATASQTAGSVSATLEVAGAAVLPAPMPLAAGVVVEVSPAQATTGQGTAALYAARITNVGSETTTFDLGGGFPGGFTAVFGEPSLTLQPGAEQSRLVTIELTPAVGTGAGTYPFVVSAIDPGNPLVAAEDGASIVVSGLGVAVELAADPPSSITSFDLEVTNTGTSTTTYSLALGGPLAGHGVLGTPMVTLPAGQSTTVPVTLGVLDGVLAGIHLLLAAATAQADPMVQAIDSTPVDVPATEALAATMMPDPVITEAGTVERLVLAARNAGNTDADVRVFISDLEGPIEADLIALDGSATQMIEGLHLPAFARAELSLDASLIDQADGDVTVRVELSDDPGVAAEAIGHLVLNPCGPGGSDIDLDGVHGPLTDGLLALRHLFGFTGATLITGVLGGGATRTDPVAIGAYIDCLATVWLDLDANGEVGPLTDGLMFLRYLFGFRGASLVAAAIGPDCGRCDAAAIEAFANTVIGE